MTAREVTFSLRVQPAYKIAPGAEIVTRSSSHTTCGCQGCGQVGYQSCPDFLHLLVDADVTIHEYFGERKTRHV